MKPSKARLIKTFEGYLDIYYEEINEDELYRLSESQIEFDTKIKDILIGWGFRTYSYVFNRKRPIEMSKWVGENIELGWDKYIYISYIGDEYYLVSIFPPNDLSDESYFKCDQFEGVRKLFKDKGVI